MNLWVLCAIVEGFASREDMPQHLLFLETAVVSAICIHGSAERLLGDLC